jgi:hypothetical protein
MGAVTKRSAASDKPIEHRVPTPQCHVEQGDLVDGGRWIGGVAVRVVLHGE